MREYMYIFNKSEYEEYGSSKKYMTLAVVFGQARPQTSSHLQQPPGCSSCPPDLTGSSSTSCHNKPPWKAMKIFEILFFNEKTDPPCDIGPVKRILDQQVSVPLTRPYFVSPGEIRAVFLRDVTASSDGNNIVALPRIVIDIVIGNIIFIYRKSEGTN